ncbi:MAG TPA: response regulator [Vicinamibacterales bacterium]|nr:response regulator [Vicinamibacterales bacterium]
MAKTLLLADDSVTIQRVIELTFAHEDVRVVAVADGKRAVEFISVERPDIVVADVGVAEVDGFGIVAHMKKSAALRDIPVLLLAGAFEPVDEGRVRASGCDGILVKPFEPQQLVGRVKELLAERRGGKNGKDKGRERNGSGPVVVASRAEPARAEVAVTPPAAAAPPPPPMPSLRLDTPSGAAAAQMAAQEPAEMAERLVFDHAAGSNGAAPEPLELPASPIWELGMGQRSQSAAPAAPAAAPTKVSLANAFSALLAAEQSRPASASAVAPPEIPVEVIEEAVRRILDRMTGETVRQVVLETAERLIREEIDKIKANPE